jgi:quercetin dioxygenase-like cupin family protein
VVIRETDPSTVSVVRVVLEPGGTTGWHSHPSSVFVAIEAGEVTLTNHDCASRTLGAGGLFVERPGRVHNVENTGTVAAILIATFAGIPPGAEARIDEADPCA